MRANYYFGKKSVILKRVELAPPLPLFVYLEKVWVRDYRHYTLAPECILCPTDLSVCLAI